jgi:ribosomal protein S18 acetylase RimI-like enzyme
VDANERDELVGVLARWAYEAGRDLENWRFRDEASAKALLGRWILRPKSEVALARWQVAFNGTEAVGGYAALMGDELADARKADLLALAALVREDSSLRQRLAAVSELFPLPAERDLYLSRIAVAASTRRRGIGRRLMEHLVAAAVRIGAHGVHADVASTNDGAIALNRSLGFETIARHASVAAGLSYEAMRLIL